MITLNEYLKAIIIVPHQIIGIMKLLQLDNQLISTLDCVKIVIHLFHILFLITLFLLNDLILQFHHLGDKYHLISLLPYK